MIKDLSILFVRSFVKTVGAALAVGLAYKVGYEMSRYETAKKEKDNGEHRQGA